MPKFLSYLSDSYLLLPNKYFKYKNKLNILKIYIGDREFLFKDVSLVRAHGRKAIKLSKNLQKILKKENIKEVIVETFI